MNKPVLLVVDDVDMNRDVIRRFLKNEYEVLEASNGLEALEVLHAQPVDALLLDIIMPKMDGLELLERVRADRAYDALGVLVATSTKEKTERQALAGGADDIVSKPYDPTVIKVRLGNILAKKRLEQYVNGEGHASAQKIAAPVSAQAQDCVRLIETASRLMLKNLGNKKLVEEFARQINDQAALLAEIFADTEEAQS